MIAPLKIVYDLLRGFGGIVEGAELLLTHRRLWRPMAVHFAVGAALAFAATTAVPPLRTRIAPYVPSLSLPWYLVFVEWAWGAAPTGLALAVASLAMEAAYLSLARPSALIRHVLAIRGCQPGGEDSSSAPGAVGVAAGGVLCAAAVFVPCAGIPLALIGALLTLGAGLLYAPLRLLGGSHRAIGRTLGARIPLCIGMGLGLVVLLAIPVVSLAALPLGIAGATCVTVRDERTRG